MIFIKEQKQMIIVAAGVAMLTGFFVFRYLPLRDKLARLEQQKTRQKLVIKKAEVKSEQLSQLEKKKQQLKSFVGDYGRKVPSEKELGSFLQRIAGLMDEHQLEDQIIEPGKQKVMYELNCMLINMKCKGKLREIYNFFVSLQNLDRTVRIQQVRLGNSGNYSGKVNMSTEVAVYSTTDGQKG